MGLAVKLIRVRVVSVLMWWDDNELFWNQGRLMWILVSSSRIGDDHDDKNLGVIDFLIQQTLIALLERRVNG